MSVNNNISEELIGLKSTLTISAGDIYFVPPGYFEGLPLLVLSRIRALETTSVSEELEHLSPFLNTLSRDIPYSVPPGYFKDLEGKDIPVQDQTAAEELEMLSPLLSGMKKDMPYTVPVGYFDQVPSIPGISSVPAKQVSMFSRKWLRYAAAAVITGIIVLAGSLIMERRNMEAMPLARFEKKLHKEIDKMSDKEIDEFIQYTDAGLNGEEKVSTNPVDEIKDFLKDVPESELKEFIEETSVTESETSMMN